MAFTSEMFDQLRDLLNDATDTQVSFATKKMWLNRGIRRMWPTIYRIETESVATSGTARNYPLSTLMGPSDGYILGVEIEDENGDFSRFDDYDILPGDEEEPAILVLTGILPPSGTTLAVRHATFVSTIAAASYAASQSETYVGPDNSLNLPVLYAMAMITARKIDDRQDTNRYSTTQAQNGVSDQDIMGASQLWMGQFELELESLNRPLPIARD